ncbi:hypothetical protein Tco_1030579 [Tanacetum coccineum]|uniref:Uncharacterized protein n=1 Tax=Tanacetum coccineum TaxID=301880 RepID=A0ABQ5G6M7_9ASTR
MRWISLSPPNSMLYFFLQEAYIKEALGRSLLAGGHCDETYKNILNHDFKITLSRSRPAFKEKKNLGTRQSRKALKVNLFSKDHRNLKNRFEGGDKKVKLKNGIVVLKLFWCC